MTGTLRKAPLIPLPGPSPRWGEEDQGHNIASFAFSPAWRRWRQPDEGAACAKADFLEYIR
ncbi:MAG: hypothetical protein DI589_12365 [Shinella sp.]|nr:MAG: hypothetical protein DI589_12365 [Shinella sp.]